MRRVLNGATGFVLLLALAGLSSCVPPPNPYSATPGAGATKLGSTAADASQPDSAVPLKDATVDQRQSRALTDYLKAHHLPLVGAQVLSAPDGQREVILFGYVATPFGKSDAEERARTFDSSSKPVVINRIKVSRDLVQMGKSPAPGDSNADTSGAQAYEQQQSGDPYQQYQANQYQSQSSGGSGVGAMLPLLGLLGSFGGGFGGGGFGGSFGGFGTGFGPSGGGYGYPSYPPPVPGGFGPAPPYPPYP